MRKFVKLTRRRSSRPCASSAVGAVLWSGSSDDRRQVQGHGLLREGDRSLRELRRDDLRRSGREDHRGRAGGRQGQGRDGDLRRVQGPGRRFAQIVPISVISDRYVEFAPSTRRARPARTARSSTSTDTEIPAELDDVFKQLKKLLDAIEARRRRRARRTRRADRRAERDARGPGAGSERNARQRCRAHPDTGRSGDDISGLLINLDELFQKLAPRADSIATLNKNFAIVMQSLVESRTDLEGTLEGLGNITTELSDLVQDNGSEVASILRRAARITPVVLRHQDSVEQSLDWLGVVGEGLENAYHGGEFKSTDVRSNRVTAGLCEDLDDLPFDPDDFPPPLNDILQDLLEQLQNEICPNPPASSGPVEVPDTQPGTVSPPSAPDILPDLKVDCDKGVRKVKRQIRRINEIGIPEDVKQGLLEPIQDNLEELAKKCRKIGEVLEDPDALDDLLDQLPEELQDILDPGPGSNSPNPVDDLTGNASGAAPAPTNEDEDDSWVDGLMNFLGVSS